MKKPKPVPGHSSRFQTPKRVPDAADLDAAAETALRPHASLLSVMAGTLGLCAVVCFLAAGLAFATTGMGSGWGWSLVTAFVVCSVGAWLGRVRTAKLARDASARQRLALGTNALFSTALLGIVLLGLNFMGLSHHTALDLTTNRVNTLSPQTQRVLSRLSGPVRFVYLYVPAQGLGGRPDNAAVSLLEAYRNASNRVTTEFVNVITDPLRGRALNPRTPLGQFGASAVLLIERDSATQTADTQTAAPHDRQETAILDEANVTSALLRLQDPTPRTFYYLTGHGESDPLAAQTSLSALHAGLSAQNVQLKPLSLLSSGAHIPTDAATVFAFAPQADLSQNEQVLLLEYLNGKGRLALLLAPTHTSLPRWGTVLLSRGIRLSADLVLDPQQNYQSPQIPLGRLGARERHPLLRGTSQDVLFPSSVALLAQPRAPGLSTLFATSASAQTIALHDAKTVKSGDFARGPFVLSAVSERGDSRLWVTASASFATDAWNTMFGDASFALAGLNWTAGDAALISIPPHPPVTNTLNAPSAALRFIQLFSVFTLPVFILIVGGVVWWRRR